MRWSPLPAVLLICSLPSFAAGFHPIGLPGSQLNALSDDGRSAAGSVIGGASGGFRWRSGASAELLAAAVSARAISASGRYVTGSSLDGEHREVATYWDETGTPHALGGLPGVAFGSVLSVGFGITDEKQVVGMAATADRRHVAFHWTPMAGLRQLGAPDAAGSALGISSDGQWIFGWTQAAGGARRGALWNINAASTPALVDIDAEADELTGASRAATVLLGVASDGGNYKIPYRWSPGKRARSLTQLCDRMSCPIKLVGSSDDGRIAVGSAGNGGESVAVVWTSNRGLQPLHTFLADHAIKVPPGWTLSAATAISRDGRHLGGFGLHRDRFDSFVVELPPIPAAPANPTAPQRFTSSSGDRS